MARYRAVSDFPPSVKQGDVVEFEDDLLPELKPYFERYVEDELTDKTVTDETDTIVTNPDREKLKARATELEIPFASNIPTARLMELIEEKEAELADNSEDEDESGESDDESGESGESGEE